MSSISPNTKVYICRGVPFENNYENTILFDNSTLQISYFSSKIKITADDPTEYAQFLQHTYQRANSNTIRVDCPIEKVYDCNYLYFRNADFENKYIYAFINEINYVNNNCTELVYEIDVIQTYMFDYEFEDCFIERQHSVHDYVFGNTVPENLEIGDYVYKSLIKSYSSYNDFSLDIVAPFSMKVSYPHLDQINTNFDVDKNVSVGFYNQLFSGLIHNTFDILTEAVTDPTDPVHPIKPSITDIEEAFGNMPESYKEQIVAIYILPKHMTHAKTELPSDINASSKTIVLPTSTADVYGTYTDASGNVHNVIKNNKLLCYPYNLLMVQSSDGQTAEYKYELFWQIYPLGNYQLAKFELIGTQGLPPQLMCCPQNYKPYGEDSTQTATPFNYVDNLTITNFPMSGWATNGFREWLTQSTTGLIGGLLGTMLAPGIGTVLGASIGSFTKMSFAANVYGSVAGLPKALIAPNYAHGTNKNGLMLSLNEFGFHFYNARIKDEYAKIIDDYFTKFGYAQKRLGKPNIKARPYWTYIETKDCAIKPANNKGINAEHIRKISDIYDKGITFWRTEDVGNYSLDNSPDD